MRKKLFIILGTVITTIAIIFGAVTIKNIAQKNNEFKTQEKEELRNKETKDKEQKIVGLEKSKEELMEKKATLSAQATEEFMSNGFSQKYYEVNNQVKNINQELSNIEMQIFKIKEEVNTINEKTSNSSQESSSFDPFFIIIATVFIIIFGVIIFSLVTNTKKFGNLINKDMLNDISDVAVKMAKDLNPTYKEFKCPNCGASLKPDATDEKKCEYCGAKLYKAADIK